MINKSDFVNINSIDALLKKAEIEVLLSGIATDQDGTTIVPIKCPAVGRKDNYGKDEKGEPTCVFNDTKCPYFSNAIFTLSDFVKKIECSIG